MSQTPRTSYAAQRTRDHMVQIEESGHRPEHRTPATPAQIAIAESSELSLPLLLMLIAQATLSG